MNKKIVFVMVSLAFLFISVNVMTKEVQPKEYNNDTLSTYSTIFNHTYSINLYQFGKITKELSEVDDIEDLDYILGMVDFYLMGQSSTTLVTISNNEAFNKIVQPELHSRLLECQRAYRAYMESIKELIKNKELEQIKLRKEEFKKIYDLERRLNDKRYSSEEFITGYGEHLENMLDTLNSSLYFKKH